MKNAKDLSSDRLTELVEDNLPDPIRPCGNIRHKSVDTQVNLNAVRKTAQSLLKAETTFKGGNIRRKSNRAAMLNDYAETVSGLTDS